MKQKNILLWGMIMLIAFTGSAWSKTEQCTLVISDLRCEYLENPLGIDVVQPRLSWKVKAVDPAQRALKQSAYQILAANDAKLLRDGVANLWDSYEVRSDQSTLIEYQGKELTSSMDCFWKVRVKDQDGNWSKWSSIAHWSMGILNENEWQGKWIGADKHFVRKEGWPPPDNEVPDPWLRKTFTLNQDIKQARIYITSIGYHELYINNQKIGDTVLMPSVATHKKRARYVTYDITPYLRQGKNVIGIWLGLGWSIYDEYKTEDRPFCPMVLAQAELKQYDGTITHILTDKSWKTHPSPNTLLGIWDFMHFGGELYDANKEIPNWSSPDLDDSGWDNATVYSPKVKISAEMIEPNRIIKTVRPVSIKKTDEQTYRIDMGVNMSGYFEMDLKGEPGQRIEFQFSELEDEAMTHRLRSAYILGPSGKGLFRNRFNYFTGRWVQVKGLNYKPELKDIRGKFITTDYQSASTFHCSNKLLNEIYDTTLWTFKNLSLGGYVVDCPHRERMGYGGDAHATTECGMNNFGLGAFYTKWSQDWRDVQEENGNLPYTAPTYWGGGGPGWSGYCVTLPWEMYYRYNDTRILEINYPTIKKWLTFLETKQEDDILRRWGGEWDFLGDWLWPGAQGTNGDTIETLFFNNCYWIFNLQTAAKIADILDDSNQAKQYRQRAEEVRKAVHKKFYNPDDHSYVNAFQAYLAIALLVDLPPEELRPAIAKRLEKEILKVRDGHIHAGITGGAFLFKTLLALNRQDLIQTMALKEDYPSWGHMLNEGATTIWEAWDGRNSHCHSSYLYIGTWFIEGLGGIKQFPNEAGFQHFVLQPGYIGEDSIKQVYAEHDSLHGKIVSDWRVNDGQLTLHAIIPANTSAEVRLPAMEVSKIQESGNPVSKVNDVSVLGKEEGWMRLEVPSGRYEFVVDLK